MCTLIMAGGLYRSQAEDLCYQSPDLIVTLGLLRAAHEYPLPGYLHIIVPHIQQMTNAAYHSVDDDDRGELEGGRNWH